MSYVVLYHTDNETSTSGYFDSEKWRDVRMDTFTNQKEAIDFAKKNDGVILIPAEIESKVVEPRAGMTLDKSLAENNRKMWDKVVKREQAFDGCDGTS